MIEELEKVVDLLTQSNLDRGEQIARLTELVQDGEARISRVNEMVLKLVSTINELSAKYEKHIERATQSRDNALEQCGKLVEAVTKMQAQLQYEGQRYKDLLTQYERLALRTQGTQVNVK